MTTKDEYSPSDIVAVGFDHGTEDRTGYAIIDLGAVKADHGKAEYHLIPHETLEAVGRVLKNGAEKYDEHNWRKGMKWSRLFNATMRHMWAFWRGEDLDRDSGEPHLAHVLANVMFLLSYQVNQNGEDDRYGGMQ